MVMTAANVTGKTPLRDGAGLLFGLVLALLCALPLPFTATPSANLNVSLNANLHTELSGQWHGNDEPTSAPSITLSAGLHGAAERFSHPQQQPRWLAPLLLWLVPPLAWCLLALPPLPRPWYHRYRGAGFRLSGWKESNLQYRARLTHQI
ncbi:hypothetical protein [uncultured Ferrimonas sp.]|uniref:hypothetical protein n=1 Tax=uncultured Ferrimonas sp. TaxID=432640 RepID=UPI002631598B|nr:hypothetical protein [uncultured Ferrimonas sp.]